MAEEPTHWRRDALVIPLVVGLLVAIATYFLPKLLEKGKQVTYTIDAPTAYVNTTAVSGVSINLNGIPVNNLIGYRVRLWNSGGIPVSNLPVQIRFTPKSPEFKILNIKHETVPKQEFGKIGEENMNDSSKRFVYELLNPKDEDIITIVTNEEAPIALYAKAEGLRLVQQKIEEQSWLARYGWIVSLAVATFASLLTSVLKAVGERTKMWPFR